MRRCGRECVEGSGVAPTQIKKTKKGKRKRQKPFNWQRKKLCGLPGFFFFEAEGSPEFFFFFCFFVFLFFCFGSRFGGGSDQK